MTQFQLINPELIGAENDVRNSRNLYSMRGHHIPLPFHSPQEGDSLENDIRMRKCDSGIPDHFRIHVFTGLYLPTACTKALTL